MRNITTTPTSETVEEIKNEIWRRWNEGVHMPGLIQEVLEASDQGQNKKLKKELRDCFVVLGGRATFTDYRNRELAERERLLEFLTASRSMFYE